MGRVRRVLLAACCVAFTAVGVAMVVGGDPEDRVPGAVIVCFFGLGGAGMLLPGLLTRRDAGGVELRRVPGVGGAEPALVFPYSTGKQLVGAVGLLGLGLAGLGFVYYGAAFEDARTGLTTIRIVGAFLALLGLLGGPAVLWSAATRRRYVAATPRALVLRGMKATHVLPWEHVGEVGRFEAPAVRGARQVALGVKLNREGEAAQGKRPAWRRWLNAVDRPLFGWDLSVPYESFELPGEVVEEALRRLLADPDERARAGTPGSRAMVQGLLERRSEDG